MPTDWDEYHDKKKDREVMQEHIEWCMEEIRVAKEMKEKGYCWMVQLIDVKSILYFKTFEEISPFMREEFPNEEGWAGATINTFIHRLKGQIDE